MNAAVLEAEFKNSTPHLESLVKMVYWSQNLLDKKKVSYPKMTDVASGRIVNNEKKKSLPFSMSDLAK